MCVIMIATDTRPTDEMVEKAFDTNDDMSGIAYRKDGLVHWKKGIDNVEEMKAHARNLPLPYILHFRIASIGKICTELAHPFPVQKDVPLWPEGETGGYVLFHNGSWHRWEDACLELATHHQEIEEVPEGEWSDTRAMAWMVAWKGKNVLNFIKEKCVLFSPDDMEIFRSDWEMVNGVRCSNKHFLFRGQYSGSSWTSTMCKFGHCTSKENLDADGRCPKHPVNSPPDSDATKAMRIAAAAERARTRAEDERRERGNLTLLPGGAGAADPFDQLKTLRKRGKLSRRSYRAAKKRLQEQIDQASSSPILLGPVPRSMVN